MMKRKIRTVALATLLAAGAAWTGYMAGRQSGNESRAVREGSVAVAKKEPKILFYRNPMGLDDKSPTPKKDSMGMDYIPVYDSEQDPSSSSESSIRISTEKVQKLGVRTEAATSQSLGKSVRAAGRVLPDERRLYAIAPKFEGYIERLHANVTGQPVGKGQALFEAYSPELVSAQREYAIAARGLDALKGAGPESIAAMRQLADSSLARLRNWDVSEEQIRTLARSGEAKRLITYRSPVNGVVTEKRAIQGMRFTPGEALYQVADLSSVWIIADVFEQDISMVKVGSKAQATIDAYPDKTFSGSITYVYPTLKTETRTVQVRIELANPGLLLKPGMYAKIDMDVQSKRPMVTIPISAVIDSGTRQIAFVQAREGRFEPRELKLGERSADRVEVVDGIGEGEQVVVMGNFLIDAESNLKAAIGGWGQPGQASPQLAPKTGHSAEGRVIEIDAKNGSISIEHGPIPSLKWPAMTMEFKLSTSALLGGLKLGNQVAFEFVERGKGEWVVTSLKPLPDARPSR